MRGHVQGMYAWLTGGWNMWHFKSQSMSRIVGGLALPSLQLPFLLICTSSRAHNVMPISPCLSSWDVLHPRGPTSESPIICSDEYMWRH